VHALFVSWLDGPSGHRSRTASHRAASAGIREFRASGFGLVSEFGFRASDFRFRPDIILASPCACLTFCAMPKLAPPPLVAPETWPALLAAAAEFAALRPWDFMDDSQVVGLLDPGTGETRIGCVLGNAGQVFAAVFYRRAGLRWILHMLDDTPDPEDLNTADGIDCLKLEFMPKRELWPEDRAVLQAAAFKPAGRGSVWPQFRAAEPGWHPWHITQAEAGQFLADLPRFTAFCRLLQAQPELFADRSPTEIPFLPATLPVRPLTPQDLDWHPLLPPSSNLDPFHPTAAELQPVRALPRQAGLVCEFDCSLLPGASFVEAGRPCFGRLSLLVEHELGLVLGMGVQSGALTPGEAAGRGLLESLRTGGRRPERLLIRGERLRPVLQPLCDALEIQLRPVPELPALAEAATALSRHMLAGGAGRF